MSPRLLLTETQISPASFLRDKGKPQNLHTEYYTMYYNLNKSAIPPTNPNIGNELVRSLIKMGLKGLVPFTSLSNIWDPKALALSDLTNGETFVFHVTAN